MKRSKNLLYHFLSFLLPCGCILLMFVLGGRYPFGADTALESDAAIQYYPFTLLLRRVLHAGESLLYTWRAGLGINLWSMIAYYSVNIWTLICTVLPVSAIPLFLTLSIGIRLGLAGLFFSVLLRTVREELDLSAVIFSGMYALCMWYLVNFYQLIWLDTVALTPLVLAGLLRMTRDGKCGLYTAALFLSLISNPYMSWMTCLMCGLCWIGLLIVLKKSVTSLLREIGRFLGHSLLAAGMGAVLLIPMACTLYDSAAPDTGIPALTQTEFPFGALFGRMVSFTYPILHIGMPNLSCSMLAVLLIFGYLTAGQIPMRERIVTGAILALLMVSLWYSPLSWLWHGFHTPHGFIHRFAHLVPLVMMFMGWRCTVTMSDNGGCRQLLRLIPMLAFGAGTVILSQVYDTTDIPLVSVILLLIYALLYGMRMLKPQMRVVFLGLLFAVTCGETLLDAYLTAANASRQFVADDLYPDDEMQAAADAVTADAASQQLEVYRTAMYPYRSYNPELLYDMPYGGSFYASLIPDSLCIFCGRLGMDSGTGLNYYFYQELPPLSMLLTGLQYTVMPGANLDDELYRQLGGTWGYAFRAPMLTGFCIPQDCGDLPDHTDYIAVQETLFHMLTGRDDTLYETQDAQTDATEGAALTAGGLPHSYHVQTKEKRSTLIFTFTAERDGWYVYHLDMESTLADTLKFYRIEANGSIIAEDHYAFGGSFVQMPYLTQIGRLSAGDTVTVTLRASEQTAGDICVYTARQDNELFEKAYHSFAANSMKLTEWSDTRIRGQITAGDGQMLYLPVPYDRGWTAYADGKRVPIRRVFGAMCGVPLGSGTHEIELRFFPRGLWCGIAVSAGSVLILAAMSLFHRKKRKQRQEV